MNVKERIYNAGIIPVVVIDDEEKAIETAKALIAGGIDVMEITFRTKAAKEAIKLVSDNVKEMCVGAGTITNIKQAKEALEAGAKFIISPGYDEEVVSYCLDNNVEVIPGIITPSEIMQAKKKGLSVLKFFPSEAYGGLKTMKALKGPFPDISFIPTGGININNLAEYARAPFVYAVGGSWLCDKKDINNNEFMKITKMCIEARKIMLGYEFCHVGINFDNGDTCDIASDELVQMFNFNNVKGSASNFVSPRIEMMKGQAYGKSGHIAIKTNRINMAIAELEKMDYKVIEESKKYQDDRLFLVYLEKEVGGFAIHLISK